MVSASDHSPQDRAARHGLAERAGSATADSAARAAAWPASWRWLVSALLLWHLVAVLLGPLSLGLPGSQPPVLTSQLRPLFGPYIEAAYLDHGYKFFAPDPGDSHLLIYDLELADGTHRQGQLPDRQVHWPRLRYHRHFMLSEFIANGPRDPQTTMIGDWTTWPLSPWEQTLAESFARHLLSEPEARQVKLTLRRHLFPSQQAVLEGMRLDDPTLYVDRPLGVYTRGGS